MEEEMSVSGEDVALAAARRSALERVQVNGLALGNLTPDCKQDREVVLTAVQQNGAALFFAPAEYKRDCEIVLAAVR
eukprot:3079694-Amphidinium_carterae.1